MLKAYAIGFVGAVLAILIVVALSQGVRTQEEPGLRWGGTVYTSEAAFKGYLKSKGLSYETWLARNPGAAPWEPAPGPEVAARTTAAAPEAGPAPGGETATDLSGWLPGWLPLAAFGLAAAGGAIFLLSRLRLGTAVARMPSRPGVSFDGRALRLDALVAGGRTAVPTLQRAAHVAAGAVRRLEAAAPFYGERLLAGARSDGRVLRSFLQRRNIRLADVAFALLAVTAAAMFVLFVVVLLTA
ncbi:MAG: hypothetical protein K0T00_610 [Gaiellaceae bacterium]|nr:hypothetical protein [Gaiellaceae bacterium]